MSRPGDKIHDPCESYGWLVAPVGRGRWLALFRPMSSLHSGEMKPWRKGWRVRRTAAGGFHNCRATGVY